MTDTERRESRAEISAEDLGHVSTVDYLRGGRVRAVYSTEKYGPCVDLYMDQATISLTPSAWRTIIKTVQAVLPEA